MADTIPLIIAIGDIRATDGAIPVAVMACSAEASLGQAMAAVDGTGAVAINLDSIKRWAAAKQRPCRYITA